MLKPIEKMTYQEIKREAGERKLQCIGVKFEDLKNSVIKERELEAVKTEKKEPKPKGVKIQKKEAIEKKEEKIDKKSIDLKGLKGISKENLIISEFSKVAKTAILIHFFKTEPNEIVKLLDTKKPFVLKVKWWIEKHPKHVEKYLKAYGND